MNKSLQDKTVLVTGSTQGIGLTIASAFAEARARVFINGRSEDRVSTAIHSLKQKGLDAIPAVADVSDPEAVQLMFRQLARYDGIDILVNNAALRPYKTIGQITYGEWQNVLQTNLTGTFLVTQEAVKQMRMHARGGHIISISSIVADRVLNNYRGAHYAATKAGIVAFMKHLAEEVRKDSIHTCSILPTYVNKFSNANGGQVTSLRIAHLCVQIARGHSSCANGGSIFLD